MKTNTLRNLTSLLGTLAVTSVISATPVYAAPGDSVASANTFNRLLTPPSAANRDPKDDGIHDAGNPGTTQLQTPKEAFATLPKSSAGNRVNWVEALKQKKISPRWDRAVDNAEPMIMDLVIVRQVKGTMPDVGFPHKQHTEWLDCANCHPALFEPQKGANKMSMAAMMMGQQCGVCHGTVAFPISECARCHDQPSKTAAATKSTPAPASRKR